MKRIHRSGGGAERMPISFKKLREGRSPLKIRTKIALLGIAFWCVGLLTVGLFLGGAMMEQFEKRLGENAKNIALSVSEIPDVQQYAGKPGGEKAIQPIAERIRRKTGAEYVVVFDMNGIRYSHPVPERIGKAFVGGDEGLVLHGETYVSKAIGTLGPSMRAFTPVFRNGEQVGAVAVGILLRDVQRSLGVLNRFLMTALLLGLLVGACGVAYLAWNIKRAMGGMEPFEIVRVTRELDGIIESVPEGIVAVDGNGRVSLMNSTAHALLNVRTDPRGKSVEDVIPNTRLPVVLRTGKAELGQEQLLKGSRILTSRLPIVSDGRVVGAIASFRDMSEAIALAEELTGVKRYVEALRARNHEFLNRLQAISGLIQLGEHDRAVAFISSVMESHQSLVSFIARRIKNPAVGGILLGKSSRCRELGVRFEIDPDSTLESGTSPGDQILVTVIGNLLDNAVDAVVARSDGEVRKVEFSVFDESHTILISVRDSGEGMTDDVRDRIFEPGFSTKGKERGYGLFNLRNAVESIGGDVSASCISGKGCEFVVCLPNREENP